MSPPGTDRCAFGRASRGPLFSWRCGWRWPLPALLAWLAGWGLWAAVSAAGAPAPLAWLGGIGAAALLAWRGCEGAWRRAIAGLGFPLSALAAGAASGLPAWAWLLALLPLLAAYPLRAWRDAPFFPTPATALQGLDEVVGTPRRVLDAGCGLGHGLQALRGLWPRCELHGIEWSWPLALAAGGRCRDASVLRGDMWAASWSGYDLVYVFQRPESMARAFDKAQRELAPDGWLVSLEFPVPGQVPLACLQGAARRPLWVYRPASPGRAGSSRGKVRR